MKNHHTAICARAWVYATLLGLGTLAPRALTAEPLTGEQIYRKQCASCHGQSGEGAKAYPRALAGDKPVPLLSKLIGKTMPEDNPGSLKPDEADKVAAYVHDAFYSLAARERNKPPRIE